MELIYDVLNWTTVKPLNTADLGTGEKAAVFRKRRYWESYNITYKKAIRDLKMGGGIGREAVKGGAVLRGAIVLNTGQSLHRVIRTLSD